MYRVKQDTAKSYIKALRIHHIEHGLSTNVFKDPRIDSVLRGGRRVHGETPKRLRLPLTAGLLERIVHEIRLDFDGINLKAAFCVAFAAFLRSGEFTWDTWNPETSPATHLARQHVKFNPQSVTLFLPASKSDPFRLGVPIHLAANSESTICPVQALKLLFTTYPAVPSQPLFRTSAGPFIKDFVIDRVKTLLLQIGVNATGFSGHSFRKGAAVTAKENGISRDNIKLLGRWKSDAVDIYINEVDASTSMHNILGLNAQLLTPTSHTSHTPTTSSHSNNLLSSANSTLPRHRHSQ